MRRLHSGSKVFSVSYQVILTGESESREVYVIPSNQLGAQVLLPRGPLLDMVDSAGRSCLLLTYLSLLATDACNT